MTSHSLVPSPSTGLPIARMRQVFQAQEVERKLHSLQSAGGEREHEILRNTTNACWSVALNGLQ